MKKTIDLSGMPSAFTYCNASACPLAETCLRHLTYPMADKQTAIISIINPHWVEAQRKKCSFYLKNEKVMRTFGFMRTIMALPLGEVERFRTAAIAKMGRKRFYQCRKGEVMLTELEEKLIISLANRCGVTLEDYFDRHEEVLLWR